MDYNNHGVVYTPGNLRLNVYTLKQGLDDGANYVRIYFVDLTNNRRCRVLPIEYFQQLVHSNRPGVNLAKVGLGLVYLITSPGFSSIGEYLYSPDLSTLRPLPFAPGHLGVLGYFQEKTPYVDSKGDTTVSVPLCPRTLLKRVVEDAYTTYQTKFLVGFETEFILLSSTRPVTASNIHHWSASSGFLAGSKESLLLEDIGNAMRNSGLSLQMIHPEAAGGQYEVVSGPLTPLEAADQVVFVQELIANLSAKHGLHATFAPRPFPNTAGSAAHIHISVHRHTSPLPQVEENKPENKPVDKLSSTESTFLAGVLNHLPALPAITLPTPASYERMMDGVWSGGTYVHYGTENRESPIRLANSTSPHSRNFEMRFIDGTANPHLALAAILGAGVTGIKSGKTLEEEGWKDVVGPRCAWEMSEDEKVEMGITKRMPLNIEQAREFLERDDVMKEVLGGEMVEKYLSVNKTLGDALTNQEESEEEKLTRLVEFY